MTNNDAAEPAENHDREVLRLREGGASWLEISQALGLTRQQARYAYQLGKRAERRRAWRAD